MSIDVSRDPLQYLFPYQDGASRLLLERMWSRLDHALETRRLETGIEDFGFGSIRTVTALGLIQMRIDDHACELWGGLIQDDGTFQRIGSGLPATRLFRVRNCAIWWMRFAFQAWIPERSWVDFVECPLNRPDSIELDTSRMLVRRLGCDPRFRTLPEEFDEAIGLPSLLEVMRDAEDPFVPSVERASNLWHAYETILAAAKR